MGNNNWYQNVKMPALRSTMKLAITLVCTGGESGDRTILTTVLEGLKEFYREFPREDTEEGIIIRKRQYDLMNMIGLIKYIFCQDATMVAFGRVLLLKMNYDFSGLHDEFMLDFIMRIVSNAGCCLTGLIQ